MKQSIPKFCGKCGKILIRKVIEENEFDSQTGQKKVKIKYVCPDYWSILNGYITNSHDEYVGMTDSEARIFLISPY